VSFDDPRIAFYLRNREQLSEWFAIRSEAGAAMDRWLASLARDFVELSEALGADVRLVDESADGGWPGFFLVRASWPVGQTGAPRIGLQWTRGKTLVDFATVPWVGVHAEKRLPFGRQLSESLVFQSTRRERRHSSTMWWAAYAPVPPRASFPEQAEDYRALLIDSVRNAWNDYSRSIDELYEHPARDDAGLR
jgi:hypothetical protein